MKTSIVALSLLLTSASLVQAAGPWVPKLTYRFDGSSGNMPRDDVINLTATAFNTTIAVGICKDDTNCRNFNGTSSYINVPFHASYSSPGGNNLRYAIWVNPDFPRGADDLIHTSGFPNPHWKLEINGTTGRAICGVRGSWNNSVIVSGGPDLYDNNPSKPAQNGFYKVECRVIQLPTQTDRLELWIDDQFIAATAGAIGSIVTNFPTILGRHSTVPNAGFYDGKLDQFYVGWATP